VWLSGLRWAIEQCFEETKTELGMDHYEVRKYPGWHHHILTCMLAHFFLWHLKIRLGKNSSVYYAVAAQGLAQGTSANETAKPGNTDQPDPLDPSEKPSCLSFS
jgi:hypothetical protein